MDQGFRIRTWEPCFYCEPQAETAVAFISIKLTIFAVKLQLQFSLVRIQISEVLSCVSSLLIDVQCKSFTLTNQILLFLMLLRTIVMFRKTKEAIRLFPRFRYDVVSFWKVLSCPRAKKPELYFSLQVKWCINSKWQYSCHGAFACSLHSYSILKIKFFAAVPNLAQIFSPSLPNQLHLIPSKKLLKPIESD